MHAATIFPSAHDWKCLNVYSLSMQSLIFVLNTICAVTIKSLFFQTNALNIKTFFYDLTEWDGKWIVSGRDTSCTKVLMQQRPQVKQLGGVMARVLFCKVSVSGSWVKLRFFGRRGSTLSFWSTSSVLFHEEGVLILRKRPLPTFSPASFTTHYTLSLINKIVISIIKS